ncbi:hypothetical protein SOVF_167510 [Spinacia oleracea]|nr:hypothetical protein SOVF_167510 [Spinacia oleracea]
MKTIISENEGIPNLPPKRGLVKAMIISKFIDMVKADHEPSPPSISYCPRNVYTPDANSDRSIISSH